MIQPKGEEMFPVNRVREIFTAAMSCENASARKDLLNRECDGDKGLQEAVESLLFESTQTKSFLERPAVEDPTRGLKSAEDLGAGEGPGDYIGPYFLQELVGEGGGGRVYRAEQQQPVKRTVALKILKLGMDTRSVIRRFEVERQALAVMDHPHIARVLDAGASPDGRPYFVMDFVEGTNITKYCNGERLSLRDRVVIMLKVCRAIEHAHQKGVIHRDLKPSNILIVKGDGGPVPKVIDFGVAKAIDSLGADLSVTMHDTVVGTPIYMSPEQAFRDEVDVDTRSDVYSLGVLLYELLTDYTPLDADRVRKLGIDGIRQALKESESYRPSLQLRHSRLDDRERIGSERSSTMARLEAEIRGDLDWIVMKALERDRAKRYGGASEFAADLDRYLRQLPVLASPPRAADRIGKFIKRHRTSVVASVALLAVLVGGVIVSMRQALRATLAEQEAREAQRETSFAYERALRDREEAIRSESMARLHEYVADINVGYHAVEDGHIAKALGLLERQLRSDPLGELRGFEWRYLASRCLGAPHRTLSRQAAPVHSLAFSRDGSLLAVGTRESVQVWDVEAEEPQISVAGPASAVAFLEGDEEFVVANRSGVVVHDLESGEVRRELIGQVGGGAVSLSPSHELLATSGGGGVTLWDTESWQSVRQFPNVSGPLAFSDDEQVLATGSAEGIVLWEVSKGRRMVLQDSAAPLRGLFPGGSRILFSPGGQFVVAPHVEKSELGIFYLGIWDVETGQELGFLPSSPADEGHSGMITSLAADWGAQVIASSSWDHSVRLWDLQNRRLLRSLHGHRGEVWATALSPEGNLIASGSKDGEVKVWPVTEPAEAEVLEGQWKPLSFSQDSRYVGALNRKGKVAIINLDTREVVHEVKVDSSNERYSRFVAAMTNDLVSLAEAMPQGKVRIRDLDKGQVITEFESGSSRVDQIVMAPDGLTMVTVGWRDDLAWWDMNDLSAPIARIVGRQAIFSADGKTLATVERGGSSVIWDTGTRTERLRIEHGDQSFGSSVAISPSGTVLALTFGIDDFENAVSLWDTGTGKHLGALQGHKQAIWSVAFSPDGRTLASSSADGSLRLWNVKSRRELMSLEEGGAGLAHLTFSPDGSFLVAGTPPFAGSGQIRIIYAPAIGPEGPERPIIP